ncbi:MAG: cold shock domain-containing protein [Deltaproteobacteria bacterium]|nr:cold shock domain-containing protein [Deltaproteobacteria bacterium]
MPKGKIKWFNDTIGAGFIRSDEGENVFFRFNALRGARPQAIRQGQDVHFDIAKNVRSLSRTADRVTTADFLAH